LRRRSRVGPLGWLVHVARLGRTGTIGPALVDHAVLRDAFSDFADASVGSYDIDQMLHLLTDQIVRVLGVDGAGVSLAPDGTRLTFVTATDEDIAAIEDVQLSAAEGPCHEAYLTGEPVTIPFLELDERWPTYRQAAIERGVLAVAGIPMPGACGPRIGAVNIYVRRPLVWGYEELDVARILADMASGYILNVGQRHDAENQSEQLHHALEGRDVIGQAKGILMAHHRIGASAAFELLRRVSQDRNLKLRQVAAQVVEDRRLPTSDAERQQGPART
jgi:GAF domain-containing protein